MDDPWEGIVKVLGVSVNKKALDVQHVGVDSGKRYRFLAPLSQIHDDSEIFKLNQVGETGKLVLPSWLAEKEKLFDE